MRFFLEKWTCPNISTIWGLAVVEQNDKKPGPFGQKFSKPPLKEVNEALELLSGHGKVNKLPSIELICLKWSNKTRI